MNCLRPVNNSKNTNFKYEAINMGIDGVAAAFKVTLNGMKIIFCTINKQVRINFSSYLTTIISAGISGADNNNRNTCSISVESTTQLLIDCNYGSSTKYPAWFWVFGV